MARYFFTSLYIYKYRETRKNRGHGGYIGEEEDIFLYSYFCCLTEVGEKLVEGKTFNRMPESVWQKKYGNDVVGEHLVRLDSRSEVKMKSLKDKDGL